MTYLYRYEAKSIQRYVLGTGKLQEIASASAAIENMGDDVRRRAARTGGAVRAVAAGGGTLTFPTAASLASFARDWILTCTEGLPGLHIAHGWTDVSDEKSVALGEWQRLRDRIDGDRQRRLLTEPLASPLVARAPRTARSAVGRRKDLLVDATTSLHAGDYWRARDTLFDRALPLDLRNHLSPAETVEGFGEGYLAVVHADGNGLGRFFSGLNDLTAYENVSAAVARATERAVQESAGLLSRNLRTAPAEQLQIPFRPIVLGGDDFTAILRAEDAIPFVAHFLERFAELTRADEALSKVTKGLSASAGIAFVKPGFPFRLAHRLAEELCGAAKKPFRAQARGNTPPPSSLMFHRVTSASLRSFEDIQRQELLAYFSEEPTEGGLMGGPWTLGTGGPNDIHALCRVANALVACPRGSIREWLRLIATAPDAARSHWNRMRDVALFREGTAWSTLENVLEGVGCQDLEAGPWGKSDATQELRTPLLDALIWNRMSGGEPGLWSAQ